MSQALDAEFLSAALDPAVDACERLRRVDEAIEDGSPDPWPALQAWLAGTDPFLAGQAWARILGRLHDARYLERAIAASWPEQTPTDENGVLTDDDSDMVRSGAGWGMILYVLTTGQEQERVLRALVRNLLREVQIGETDFQVGRACERCFQVAMMQAMPSEPKGGWSLDTIDWALLLPYLPDDADLLRLVPTHARRGH